LLTKSLPYYDTSFNVEGVKGAIVTLYEGEKIGTELKWDIEGIQYDEFGGIDGLYAPPIQSFFLGKPGYFYKLEVLYNGVLATSVSQIPALVPIDSIWVDNVFNPNVDSVIPFLRFQFTDPAAFGNNYMVADYRNSPNDYPLLWGAANRIVVTDDVLFNNQSFVYSNIFPDKYGDTVNMYLISIDNQAYKYWESYEASRGNGGPFSQPINVKSTFDNAKGIFQGMAVSAKRIIIKKP